MRCNYFSCKLFSFQILGLNGFILYEMNSKLPDIKFEGSKALKFGIGCFIRTKIEEMPKYNESSEFLIKMPLNLHRFVDNHLMSIIKQIFIPSSVEKIDRYAFYDCNFLKEVIVDKKSKLTGIGAGAFYNCTMLEKFDFPSNVNYFGTNCFENCVNYHHNIKLECYELIVKKSAFKNSGILSFFVNTKYSFDFSIDDFAFMNCSSFKSFSALSKRKQSSIKFGKGCFLNSSIQELNLSNCVINIMQSCFIRFCSVNKIGIS